MHDKGHGYNAHNTCLALETCSNIVVMFLCPLQASFHLKSLFPPKMLRLGADSMFPHA